MISRFLSLPAAILLLPFATPAAAAPADSHGVEIFQQAATSNIDAAPISPVPAEEGSFTGITLANQLSDLAQSAWPPSPSMAVGPNHVVEVMNQSMAVFKRNGKRLSHVRLRDFLNVKKGDITYQATFDPKVVYDIRSGRWFMACVSSGAGQTNQGDPVLLAVSKTNDPTKEWVKFVLPVGTTPVGDNFVASGNLSLGLDGNGVYIGLRMIPETGAAYGKIVVLQKSGLIAATPKVGTIHQFPTPAGLVGSPVPAVSLDATAAEDRAWILATADAIPSRVVVWRIIWNGATPGLTSFVVVYTPNYGAPVDIAHKGGTALLDTGDDRIQSVVQSNGHLWICRTIGTNSEGTATSPDRTGCEWLDISVAFGSPFLEQSGRVYDTAPTTPRSYCYPAIGANLSGDVLLSFVGAGPNDYLSAFFTGREKGEPEGEMGAIETIRAGGAAYNKTVGGDILPFGRGGSVVLDPVDRFTLWTVQAHASATTDSWGTWIASIGFSNPPGGIAVSKSKLDFQQVKVGANKKMSFTITSDGSHPLTGTITAPAAPFSIVSGGGHFSLAPGAKKTVTIKFKPTGKKTKTGTIKIGSNDLTSPTVTVKLSGTGN